MRLHSTAALGPLTITIGDHKIYGVAKQVLCQQVADSLAGRVAALDGLAF